MFIIVISKLVKRNPKPSAGHQLIYIIAPHNLILIYLIGQILKCQVHLKAMSPLFNHKCPQFWTIHDKSSN